MSSPSQKYLTKKYCTPVFQGWFTGRTRRTLDRNPIAWLQQYSWKVRLIKWVLCLAFVLGATAAATDWQGGFGFGYFIQQSFLLILAGGMTFAGINSFAEERRSGAVELILVTPISVNQIIFGRLWGIWKQFLPAALMLTIVIVGRHWVSGDLKFGAFFDARIAYLIQEFFPGWFVAFSRFIALPAFTLYFALRVKNQIVAATLAWAVLFLPYVFIELFMPALHLLGLNPVPHDIPEVWQFFAGGLADLALAAVACLLLRHSLSHRIYSF